MNALPAEPEVSVFPDPAALVRAAAETVTDALREGIETRDRATFVLTGGSTPKGLYRLLARDHAGALDWERVDVFWGDERFVPPDDADSNYRMARETMLDALPVPECNLHPVPTPLPNAEMAAAAYAATLRGYFAADEPAFDVVLMGLGADGHTASLFPDGPEVEERERWAVHSLAPPEHPVRDRVSLTVPVLSAGRVVLFLVTGRGKAEAVAATLRDGSTPAAAVGARGHLLWYLDEEAASEAG